MAFSISLSAHCLVKPSIFLAPVIGPLAEQRGATFFSAKTARFFVGDR
jgi:hypothetical protein